VLSKLLGVKALAAAVLGTAAVGTAAAAATGTLPDAAQAKAHSLVAAVPDATPSGSASARAAAAHDALPGAAGLCRAYGSGSGGDNGKRLDSTGFQQLADAAGGTDQVSAYCGTVMAAAQRAAAASTADRAALTGACRAWLAADSTDRTVAGAVLDRLVAAAGGADAVGPYCAELAAAHAAAPSHPAGPSHPAAPSEPAAPSHPVGAPTEAPGAGHGGGSGGSPSHPAPPTPRG
jgi:hypothetical protein